MTTGITAPVTHPDRFYIGGEWVAPSTDSMIDVIDSGTEDLFFRVAEAQADDIARAVHAARTAFDDGAWTALTHAEREFLARTAVRVLQKGEHRLADVAALVLRAATPRGAGAQSEG